jgi:hypothetical protein
MNQKNRMEGEKRMEMESNQFESMENRKAALENFVALIKHICGNCKKRSPNESVLGCEWGPAMLKPWTCPMYNFRNWPNYIQPDIIKWLSFCDDKTTKKPVAAY